MAWYGSWSGPTSNTRFRACLDMRTSSQNETQGCVQVRRWVEVAGSFGGTRLNTDWGSSAILYGAGTYADSGWTDYGWVDYGSSLSQSGRAYYTGGSGSTYSSTASGSYSPAVPVLVPNACTDCVNVRETDNRNAVSWTRNATQARPYAGIYVDRQVDGGVWSRVAGLAGDASSWVDASTSANHAYRYRVLPHNATGDATAYAFSETTYNTPAAPTKLEVARTTETAVRITLDNPALTATALEVQRSSDASSWMTLRSVSGSPVTALEDDPGGGTWYYRARNTRGELMSGWSSASNAVVTLQPPKAPTLLLPVGNDVVPKTQESVLFVWRHETEDGSDQSAAQVAYSVDEGVSWTTVEVSGSDQACEVPNGFAVNSKVAWRARTKGAHEEWGAWTESLFSVCQVPSVAITSPASDGALIADVPLRISWSYDDPSGAQREAVLAISDGSQKVLWSRTVQGDVTSVEVGTDELLLPNETSFALSLVAFSTSRLSSAAERAFATSYEEPAAPRLSMVADSVAGRVLLTVYAGEAEPDAAVPHTDSLGVFRKNEDGSLVCLADRVPDGTGLVDVYPPLDRKLTYVAAAYTANGLTSKREGAIAVPSEGYVFFNFDTGSGYSQVAKMAMDVEWDVQRERDSEVIETEGDEDPLVFYGASSKTEMSVSGSVWRLGAPAFREWGDGASTAEAFGRLSKDAGVKVVRFPHGDVVPAHVTSKMSVSSSNSLIASVEASIRRVRAYGLAM